jgi:hypothetical protein
MKQLVGKTRPVAQAAATRVGDAALHSPAALTLLRSQQMADQSPHAAQLRQRAQLMARHPIPALPSPQSPVQLFSDKKNDARRDSASKVTGVGMQLDHAVSQDTLEKFHAVLPIFESLPKHIRPKSVTDFRQKADALFEAQQISREGNPFLNLRNNLTAGFKNTVQNPGDIFDPQIQVNGDDVVVTEQSKQLEALDRGMRYVTRKAAIAKSLAQLDPETIDAFVGDIDNDFKMLNLALDFLGTVGTLPTYDGAHWYDFGEKKVKKVAATYLDEDDDLLARLGTRKTRRYSTKTITKFVSINMYEQTKVRKKPDQLKITPVPLTVTVTVPESTWKHIYERHVIESFAWDIQAVNTFWKTDPQDFLRLYQDEIVAELLLIIDREMDLEHEIGQAKQGEDSDIVQDNPINAPGSRFFFQGTYAFEEMSTDGTFEKDELAINLQSFAPQNAEFAYAVLPEVLAAKKPG